MLLRVLLVDDEHPFAELAERFLRPLQQHGTYIFMHAKSPEEAFRLLAEIPNPDVTLLDLHYPDSTYIQTLQRVKDFEQYAPVILISGMDESRLRAYAEEYGATGYLNKDNMESKSLITAILDVIDKKFNRDRNERQSMINQLRASVNLPETNGTRI